MKTGVRIFKLYGSDECVVRVKGRLYRTHSCRCQKTMGYQLTGHWSPKRKGCVTDGQLADWLKSLPFLEGETRVH